MSRTAERFKTVMNQVVDDLVHTRYMYSISALRGGLRRYGR